MSPEYYYVACPGVLGIRTNIKDFKWSYGTSMPTSTREEFEACRLRMRVERSKQLELPPVEQRVGKYHYWSGAVNHDAVYYDRSFMFGSRLRIAATGLLGEEPVIRVNDAYHKRIKHRFMNLHSLGYILTDLAGILLLKKGFAPLHCSAFRKGGSTVVIAAAPNTGKTLTAMMACLEHQADYIAEDLAITDGFNVYSVPWTSTFRYYKQVDDSLLSRAKNRLTKVFPPFELIAGSKPNPITDFVEADRMVSSSPISHLVVLQRGEEKAFSVDSDEAYRQVRNLNRYEFNYHRAPLVIAHEYFSPAMDIAGACAAEDRILHDLVCNAAHRCVVQSMDATRYSKMILDLLDNAWVAEPNQLQVA